MELRKVSEAPADCGSVSLFRLLLLFLLLLLLLLVSLLILFKVSLRKEPTLNTYIRTSRYREYSHLLFYIPTLFPRSVLLSMLVSSFIQSPVPYLSPLIHIGEIGSDRRTASFV